MDEILKRKSAEGMDADSVGVQQAEANMEAEETTCPEPGDAECSGGEEHYNPEENAGTETGAEEPIGEATKSPEVLALEEEKKRLVEHLSRLQADFNNYRRRVEQEKEELRGRANAELLATLLPIIDNFERAIAVETTANDNYAKGVEMIYRQLLNLLNKEGVTVIEAEGQTLDPHLHHAVMREVGPEGVAEDTILEVLQKGYLFKERVLRPAMVKVAE